MRATQAAPATIDQYIAGFPPNVQQILQEIRATIRKAAPDAQETISYRIPTFILDGRHLIYFAGFANHVSVYPAPVGNPAFKKDLGPYASGKGTARFALDEPIPFELITRIVEFRAKENAERKSAKPKRK